MKSMYRLLCAAVLCCLTLIVSGCATDADRMNAYSNDYKLYLEKAAAPRETTRPPLFKMVAQPGQTIELKGVQVLEINAPDVAAQNQVAQVAPPTQVKSIGSEIWGFAFDAFKTSLPFVAQGVQGYQQMRTSMRASDNNVLITQSNNATTASMFNAFGATTSNIANAGFNTATTLGGRPTSVINVSGNNNAVAALGATANITTTTVTCPGGNGGNGSGAASGTGGTGGAGAQAAGAPSGAGGAGNAGAGGTTNCRGG